MEHFLISLLVNGMEREREREREKCNNNNNNNKYLARVFINGRV